MKTYWIVNNLCFLFTLWHSGEPTIAFDFWTLNHSITQCCGLLRINHIISFSRQNLRLASRARSKVPGSILIYILLRIYTEQDIPHTSWQYFPEEESERIRGVKTTGCGESSWFLSVRDFEQNIFCWVKELSISFYLIPLSLCTYAEISKLLRTKSEAFSNNLLWEAPLFP